MKSISNQNRADTLHHIPTYVFSKKKVKHPVQEVNQNVHPWHLRIRTIIFIYVLQIPMYIKNKKKQQIIHTIIPGSIN